MIGFRARDIWLLIVNTMRLLCGGTLTMAIAGALQSSPGVSLAAFAAMLAIWFGLRSVAEGRAAEIDRAGLMILALLILVNFIVAFWFSSMQPSDFGVYFRCAWRPADTLDMNVAACQSKYLDLGNLFWMRSVLYTVPLNAIFDHSYMALKLANAGLQSIFLALLWFCLRSAFGAPAALLGLLCAGIYPERLYAIPLATTDHLTLPLITLAFLSIGRTGEGLMAIAFAVLTGGISVVANAARGVGLFLQLGALLGISGGPARLTWKLATMAAVLFASFVFSSAMSSRLGGSLVNPTGGVLAVVSGLDIASSQSFASTFAWLSYYWPAIPPGEQWRVVAHRLYEELALNGGQLPQLIFEKASKLFDGSGYAAFATLDFSSNLDTELTSPPGGTPKLSGGDVTLRALALPSVVAGWLGVIMFRPSPLSLSALGFLMVMFATLVLFFTMQPRYGLVGLPALAVLAAHACGGQQAQPVLTHRIGTAASALFAALAIVFVVWRVAETWSDIPLREIRQQDPSPDGACDTARAQIAGDALRRRLTLPAGETCATFVVPMPRGAKSASLFIGSGLFPYAYETKQVAKFNYATAEGAGFGTPQTLGDKSIEWVTAPVQADRLTIRIRRLDAAEAPIDVLLAHVMAR